MKIKKVGSFNNFISFHTVREEWENYKHKPKSVTTIPELTLL